jgi:hypothetical protein
MRIAIADRDGSNRTTVACRGVVEQREAASFPRRALHIWLRIGINSNAIALCNISISINRPELRLLELAERG